MSGAAERDQVEVVAPPPRSVPASLRAQQMFGGIGAFGWVCAGFGGMFVWVFALNADLSFLDSGGALERTTGQITRVTRTGASEGGSEDSEGTPIYAYAFEFTGRGGVMQRGTSYATGKEYEAGAAVRIEYPAGRPERARIRGMRRKPFSAWAVFPIIFPIVGLSLAMYQLRKGRRAVRLLAEGQFAVGRLKSREATRLRVNDRTVYRLEFEFTGEDGRTYTAVTKTNAPERLEDEAEERLLYHPDNPERAIVLDALSGRIRFDERGELRPAGPWCLLFPVLAVGVVAGHAVYALVR